MTVLQRSFDLKSVTVLLIVIWTIHICLELFDIDKSLFANKPNEWPNWFGVFTSPLIHGTFSHIVGNSIYLLFFGGIMQYLYQDIKNWVLIPFLFLPPIITFFIGISGTYHSGISGLEYALAWCCVIRGFFKSDHPWAFMVSLAIIAILPNSLIAITPEYSYSRISWETHLGGVIVGAIVALLHSYNFQFKIKRI